MATLALILIGFLLLSEIFKTYRFGYYGKYLGIRELKSNSEFNDPSFKDKLKSIGWKEGESWCTYFVILTQLERPDLTEEQKLILKKIMNGSAVATYNNLVAAANKYNWIKLLNEPSNGSLIFWQRLDDAKKGHAGIIENSHAFITIEGNTGFEKEEGIFRKFRKNWEIKNFNRLKYFIKIVPNKG